MVYLEIPLKIPTPIPGFRAASDDFRWMLKTWGDVQKLHHHSLPHIPIDIEARPVEREEILSREIKFAKTRFLDLRKQGFWTILELSNSFTNLCTFHPLLIAEILCKYKKSPNHFKNKIFLHISTVRKSNNLGMLGKPERHWTNVRWVRNSLQSRSFSKKRKIGWWNLDKSWKSWNL